MGIKERFGEMKELGKLTARLNWDYALAAGVAELPILRRDGYIHLPSSLEELIPLIGMGLTNYPLLKKDSTACDMWRQCRNAFIIFFGVFAGNYDPKSPLANYDALLALEMAGMSLFSHYLFVRGMVRGDYKG